MRNKHVRPHSVYGKQRMQQQSSAAGIRFHFWLIQSYVVEFFTNSAAGHGPFRLSLVHAHLHKWHT